MRKCVTVFVAAIFMAGILGTVAFSQEAAAPAASAEQAAAPVPVADTAVVAPAVTEPAAPTAVTPSEEAAKSIENTMYTYGKVVKVGDGQVVILEYDFEKDQDVEIAYKVATDTVLQDMKSFDDIKVGEEIEIMFEEKDGGRVAKMISKSAEMKDEGMAEESEEKQ